MILALIVYLWTAISILVQGFLLFRSSSKNRILVPVLNGTAALILLVLLVVRSLEIRFPALTGSYESLLFYALCILAISAAYGIQKRLPVSAWMQFLVTTAALGFLLVASSPLISSQAFPPIPALQSGWLILHIAFSFIGEAFFVFSFFTALAVLLIKEEESRKTYDRLTYTAVMAGFPIFTLGALIFGAVWAEAAWGSFWSWDPKETWALITWLVYAVYLHLRLYRKSGRILCAWMAVIGFLCTVFTFFGVNFLLSGLHSYS